jgi:hypothetical protein
MVFIYQLLYFQITVY